MNDVFKAWADGWTATQEALLKSSMGSPAEAGTQDADRSSMQQQFDDLQTTWKESMAKWTELATQASERGSLAPEALRRMFTPAQWIGHGAGILDTRLQQALDGPKFATLWDLDRKLAELQQLASRRDKDVAHYQAVVQRAWNTALERFLQSFGPGKATAPKSWREMTDRWMAVANDTLIEARRSNEFVEAQSRMVRSASDHRLQERKIAEAWCDACHIPTRSEMDEMQRTVVELKRQMRLPQRRNTPPAQIAPLPTASRKPHTARAKTRQSTTHA